MIHRLPRSILLVVAACLAVTWGCESTSSPDATVSPGSVGVCTNCGQIKGTAACCLPDAPTCSKCDLAKGSPGCCRIEKGSTEKIALCTKCGEFKGGAACCSDDATTCSKCNMHKGSPGCCKMDTE